MKALICILGTSTLVWGMCTRSPGKPVCMCLCIIVSVGECQTECMKGHISTIIIATIVIAHACIHTLTPVFTPSSNTRFVNPI